MNCDRSNTLFVCNGTTRQVPFRCNRVGSGSNLLCKSVKALSITAGASPLRCTSGLISQILVTTSLRGVVYAEALLNSFPFPRDTFSALLYNFYFSW